MKKYLFIAFAFVCLSCQSSSAEQKQVANCLEREWKNIDIDSIPAERKSFDLDNDVDQHGGSFSCTSYITPFEVNQFIEKLKVVVKNNNMPNLEPLIYFPFVLIHERKTKGEKADTMVIKSMEEFTPLYKKVFYPEMKKLIECISLDKLATSPSSGIDAAFGGLIINRYAESRRLYLTSVSMDKPPVKKWMDKFCSN
jgi:hypothetical protein